jgi:haloacetate dehalogenase
MEDAMENGNNNRDLARRSFLGMSLGAAAGALAQPVPLRAEAAAGVDAKFFPGFRRETIATSGTTINLVVGGSGPPVLLLHGFPATHLMWHRIAPALARDFTVVAADLRGYGDSGRPPDGENHFGHSKRVMARDQVEAMAKLGFSRFMAVGHDRGGRVVHRMALDHTEKVTKLVLMDILPTLHTFQNVDRAFATNNWYWFFLLQPSPIPETMIGNSLDLYLKRSVGRLMPDKLLPEIYADYFRCFNDPVSLHAYAEDYRAAATIDLDHDEADQNTKIACPTLYLWGESGNRRRDPLSVWRERAVQVTGRGMPTGHHIVEEAPSETLAELQKFLRA